MRRFRQLFSTPKRAIISTLCLIALAAMLGAGADLAADAIAEHRAISRESAQQNLSSEAAQTSGSSTEQAASGRTQATTEDVTRIGIDKAKQIAVSHAGIALSEAAFQKAKLEKDNGRTEYEIEFYHEGIEYDYTVDAASGKILEYDIDRDD
ncbi:MAG: PepSY domain-containing protein [Eubacteriales bacterium]|nr:PepSY domain-containing protein [Eubacteriales bacterium]